MIARDLRRRPNSVPAQRKGDTAPPAAIEVAYYVSFLYAYMAPALGIQISLLGFAMLAGVAALCVKHFKFRLAAFEPIKFPVACGLSFIVIQVLFHGESILSGYTRNFVPWILTLIVAQSLVRRPGFMHRLALLMFLIGLASLPFLVIRGPETEVERAAVVGVASILSNSNGLGGWFGFCAVYFMVLGLENKRDSIRLLSWGLAAGCLFVVGLTVSRGAILGVVLAGAVVFKRLPKRGLLPISVLILGSGLIFALGVYRQSLEAYEERGMEDSGRLEVLPLATERFVNNFLIGVGDSQVGTWVPGSANPTTPHNSFLFIALASGIVPLMYFTAYSLKAVRGALSLESQGSAFARLYVPIFVYACVHVMLSNDPFMEPWTVVTFAGVLTGHYRKAYRPALRMRSARHGQEISGRGRSAAVKLRT